MAEKAIEKAAEEIGTVISTPEGPSPGSVDFIVYTGVVHRGQFVEMDYAEGTLVCLVTNVMKSNRYFERFESVKEFERSGTKIFEQFPTQEWEYLVAMTRPLGAYDKGLIKRSTFPPSPGTKVRIATRGTLEKFLGFDLEKGLHLGEIEHHDTPVKLNLSRLFQKHLAILAMSGAGKCVTGGTKILLEGMAQKTIRELVESAFNNGKSVEDGVEFFEGELGLKTYSLKDGKITPAKILGYYRRKSPEKIVRIRTRAGKFIELTNEHMVPVFRGRVHWIQAQELANDDYMLSPLVEWEGKEASIDFSGIISENKATKICGGFAVSKTSGKKLALKHAVDKGLARLLAYLLAEGHNTMKSRVTFTNFNQEIQRDFTEIISSKFRFNVGHANSKGELYFDSVLFSRAFAHLGFTNSSWTKFVPAEVLSSKKEVLESFLASFIDCDGYVNKAKSEIEITLASKGLADGIEEILYKLGIISFRKIKRADGKEYQRIFVRGAEELRKLSSLNLLIDYKREALKNGSGKKANTNINAIPCMASMFSETLELLRMPQPQSESSGIINYLNRNDNPSKNALSKLIVCFEKRALEVEAAIGQSYALWRSLPNTTKNDALGIVQEAYRSGLMFKQISLASGISSTTARRVVRGITSPKHSVFLLAESALKVRGKSNPDINVLCSLDFNGVLSKIKSLCEKLNYPTEELCTGKGLYKQFLYSHSTGRGVPDYSAVLSLGKSLFELARASDSNLAKAKALISTMKSALNLNAFFDVVQEVQIADSKCEYVYDLSVEGSNFTANGLLVHNSYLVSVLLEELLLRKKEDGRIGVLVMDAHGEYRAFAEPVRDGKGVDFSAKTRFVRAGEIQIGVPKLSIGLLAALIPGLSAPQKRDLARVIDKLRREMKEGLGPFDFGAVKAEVSRDAEIKGSTKDALIGWVMTLEQLGLFGKTDNPSITDLVRPGQLTIIDLSDVIELRKKQIIVAYYARKLFDERRSKRVPPFTIVLEEAHQLAPEKVSKEGSISKNVIETIAREGRKFGAGICLISQRPVNLSTTALSQCGTHIILRVTNPYDLDHIKQTSEGIDQRTIDMITSLRTGEGIIVGEAVNYPAFFKVRKKLSQDSKHEVTLEKSAIEFEEKKRESEKDIGDLL